MKKPTRRKTKNKLLSLTDKEKYEIGIEMERLINNELSYIVNRHINSYKKAACDTFGWDRDDLLQYVRESVWKGLATFDRSLGYKVETYICSILSRSFFNLSKKCKTKKHSMTKMFCPDELFETEEMMFHDTGEDWVRYGQSFGVLLGNMEVKEQKIMVLYLVHGKDITEMSEELKIKRTEVVRNIKTLKQKIKIFMEE